MKREEQALQIACIKWFNLQYSQQAGRLYANYNNPPNKVVGAILKAMGLRAGVADLSYMLPEGKIAYIELKSRTGKQTATQKEFEKMAQSTGAPYHLAHDIYEFMGIINAYNAT